MTHETVSVNDVKKAHRGILFQLNNTRIEKQEEIKRSYYHPDTSVLILLQIKSFCVIRSIGILTINFDRRIKS